MPATIRSKTVTRFGNYEVLYELRSGGMGKVLLARRRGPGGFEKLVAIKTIRTDLAAAAAQMRAMFLDEAAILARLSHPAVATVHDFGDIDGALYLVMEYVAGVPLHHLVGNGTPPLIAAQVVAAACRGIHAAHELCDLSGQLLGVVHRDISPDNVLIGFDGHVKVIDFGIALSKGRRAAVTEMGMLKGKPPYMSPEQIKNEATDRRSDVYSFGVVLWELLTGRPLFGGDSVYAIVRAIEDQPISAPSTVAGPLPSGLDAVVLRALARDPASRFATAAEMAGQLEQIVAAGSSESLESYCGRTLADERESHRRWLGSILVGDQPAPRGRSTGTTTAVAETVDVNPGPDPVDDLEPFERRPGGRRFLGVAAAVAAVAALVVTAWQIRERPGRTHRESDAAFALIRGTGDSAEVPPRDEPPPVPRDIGGTSVGSEAESRPVASDVGRDRSSADARSRPRRRDVAATQPPVEASPGPPAVGTGYLKVTANPFAYVSINGGSAVSTPILKAALPAGTHKVVLTDPSSGDRLLERTVTIAPDQLTTVSFP